MAGRLVTGLCLAVLALAGCSDDPAVRPQHTAPAPRTLEQSWSQLYVAVRDRHPLFYGRPDSTVSQPIGDHATVRSLSTVRDQRRGCFTGPRGARLSVSTTGRGRETFVYRFSRGTCTYRGGRIVVRQPEGLDMDLVRGERTMLRVPALRRIFLEDRRFGVHDDMTRFVRAARRIERRTGTFPASYDAAEFERRGYWRGDGIRLDYRPGDARRSFRLCLQHGDDGPWRAFDTGAGGVVALGDNGPCTFRPPRPGSENAVRLAAERLAPAMEAIDVDGARVPSARADRILARFDVDLGRGVSLVRAGQILDEENYPSGFRYCVQHGRRGAWAVSDVSVGMLSGPSGECDWRLRTASKWD